MRPIHSTTAELETILGLNYSGVLSSDDYSVYNGYDVKAQQKCLAPLRRHFKKLIKLPGLNNQKIREKFVKLIDEAFKNYSLFPILRTLFKEGCDAFGKQRLRNTAEK
jgi:hypothetical protein